MIALALLLAVDPPPAGVRLEVKETVVVGDAAPVVTTDTLEAAVAADGTASARAVHGERACTLRGTLRRRDNSWLVETEYKDVTSVDWVPAPCGVEIVEEMSQHGLTLSSEMLGRPLILDALRTEKKLEGGPVERRTLTLSYTLLPVLGAQATLEPMIFQMPSSFAPDPKP